MDLNGATPDLEKIKNNAEAIDQLNEEINHKDVTKEQKEYLQSLNNKELSNIQKNVKKMKEDLRHGRTPSQVAQKQKDKIYGGKNIVNPKDFEREYIKGHYKQKGVKLKTPTKRKKF